VFTSAANALGNYANALEWAQAEAARAIELWNAAEAQAAAALVQHEEYVRGLRRGQGLRHVEVLNILAGMDGEDHNLYSIWRLPPGVSDFTAKGDTFIQAAGSAQAMAVEARIRTNDGATHLFALGRKEPVEAEPTTIRLDDEHSFDIPSNEVFTAEEAAVIFLTFYTTDSVSQPYQLREIHLAGE
jgi:hypothetical protein